MNEEVIASFGPALRDLRRKARLSQRALAERTGLDFSYISKLENGRLPPPAADTVVAICRVLNEPPEALLALTGKIPSEVQQTMSKNAGAQRFMREAQRLKLTEDEWEHLATEIRHLRDEP